MADHRDPHLTKDRLEVVFRQRWDDADLIAELQRVAAEIPDGPLTVQQVSNRSGISFMTWKRRLGPTWEQVLATAGLGDRYSGTRVTPKRRQLASRSMDAAAILTELRNVADRAGSTAITPADVEQHSQLIGLAVLRRRFGSFATATEAAGLSHRRPNSPDLMAALERLEVQLGRTPTRQDLLSAADGYPTWAAYRYRYGNWASVRTAYAAYKQTIP